MTSHEIRQAFLDFFKSKGHLIVPSAPLVAKNDPTLMFNNSGMAQFKDFFLGNGTPPSKRIADTQKCLRVSGKHNDLEDVGFDTYHHTMFEMLGNWSFGDYFKKEALAWSWELLTEVYKLPKDRIYVSVFKGDEKDGVPFDQEAWDIWKEMVGEDRIILGNKKDNFWEMGDTGPCGPCSEIHIDLRDQAEVDAKSGKELVNADHPQVVEIWNNVFMQFERKADGSLITLPAKHVDTGMGFERLCMAIQGKKSNYDTDIFQNTIQVIEKMCGKQYGLNGTLNTTDYTDIAMRVIADHLRAVSFAIADGQLPSNAKAGYVIRRILRRAIRYGYSYLGFTEPFMCRLVPVLAEQFKDVFPELKAQEDFVTRVVHEEEKSFLRTLEAGIKRFELISAQTPAGEIIDGEVVFELSDTFGFPVDLTALLAKEKGYKIDEAGYEKALAEQKNRSRQDAAKEATDWVEVSEGGDFEFLGYDTLEATAQIVKYRKVKTKAGEEYHIVLDRTPFYAEMGGQVGDSGELRVTNDEVRSINIVDTKKENDLFVHISRDKNLEEILNTPHLSLIARVDAHRRQNIMRNHTATHLMLAGLRKVLGTHIVQKGSYQNDEVTRFDFSHFAKVTDEELKQVEDIVNAKIRANIAQKTYVNVPIDEAIKKGATATFGEKYGDFVRVVEFDPQFSVELCGGTHVPFTGEIALFKFTSEGSVSAGVRRVEAVTGEKALELWNEELRITNTLRDMFKGQKDLVKAVEGLIAEKTALQKRIEALENEKLQQTKQNLLAEAETKGDISVIIARVDVANADALKSLAYQLKEQLTTCYIVLGTVLSGKPQLAVMLSEDLVAQGKHAGNIVKDLAKEVKGGGGGQPFFATAGGSDANGLEAALAKAKTIL
ncbi:alanine--tRNA ligase [Runella slithyformis]|uniref:Alanine--tRNA ligase n=1 Tax=Runella slithyformis (strain ATCC 29530 / DSM 19594 / LMG 11500 / NCIMB 11436 / LSU 4) TaxID=761193 RepID=A0A7U3ZI03_RUNSL|nr:alanine--tRNA ligase [Runella slithyformis]AEI47558.1 alanyl-tRNA synthetase [Runella slithyformis DSM 19594]